jgi:NAD(P)-dependent dehydrogenase (short-subunit alcohol dehydrogenase family)
MDINMKGVWLSCRAQGRAMLAHGQGGAIVNIASMSGVIVNRGLDQAHYNASKAGVIHLSKSMAMEWVGRGIRVNSISPGYTATPMNTRPEMIHQTREFESQTPMQRMATVDEMVLQCFCCLMRRPIAPALIYWWMAASAAGKVSKNKHSFVCIPNGILRFF